jgi:hypothetical protein
MTNWLLKVPLMNAKAIREGLRWLEQKYHKRFKQAASPPAVILAREYEERHLLRIGCCRMMTSRTSNPFSTLT